MDELGGQYDKWSKPDTERQTLRDSTYMWNLKKKKKSTSHSKQTSPGFCSTLADFTYFTSLIPGHGLLYFISAPMSHPEPPSKSQCKHPTPWPQPLPSQMTLASTLCSIKAFRSLILSLPFLSFFPQFNSFQNKSIPSPNKWEWPQGVDVWGCGLGVSIFQSSLVIRICSWVENHCSPSEYQNIQFSS